MDGRCVVLLHGFGAPGDDLVPLGQVMDVPGARWVLPAAPLQPPMLAGGRAWWMLDLEKLERSIASGEPRDLSDEKSPLGMADARAHVLALLQSLFDEGVTPEKLVLGGFSQGAMLACDVALHLPKPPAALVLLSGAPIALETWTPLLPRLSGVPVFQSHGRADALLSFAAAEKLSERLRASGARLEWLPFAGGHEIPRQVLAALESFLRRV